MTLTQKILCHHAVGLRRPWVETGEILRITALQQILGPIGFLNMALLNFGFQPIEALMYSNTATLIGLTYLWIPFMVLATYLSLLNFDFNLLEVAKVNGAGPFRAFFEVAWPLNRAGTMIGIVLVFIPTLASSVSSQFLGGPNGALFGNILAHQFGATGTWALGSAMGVVLFKNPPLRPAYNELLLQFSVISGLNAFIVYPALDYLSGLSGDWTQMYDGGVPWLTAVIVAIQGGIIAMGLWITRNPSMRGFLERAAINAPIQGSAADIIRRAMIRMPAALQQAKLGSVRMLLQVHDELVFEAKAAEADKALPAIRKVMEKAAEPAVRLAVPVHVDAKTADNWEAAH